MKKLLLFILLLNSNVCFGHVLGDYHFFGVEKFMRCEGELGITYLKLEKKWFQDARIFQKEDGIWNELCLKDKKQGKNFKKNLTLNGGKCEYEELSEKKGRGSMVLFLILSLANSSFIHLIYHQTMIRTSQKVLFILVTRSTHYKMDQLI